MYLNIIGKFDGTKIKLLRRLAWSFLLILAKKKNPKENSHSKASKNITENYFWNECISPSNSDAKVLQERSELDVND